jgi:hypothetical protein
MSKYEELEELRAENATLSKALQRKDEELHQLHSTNLCDSQKRVLVGERT